MIGVLAVIFMFSLVTAQDWNTICPEVPSASLPESVFMTQIEFDCPDNLYGKIFYTCYNGRWNMMEECRCRAEVDEYGYRWWGVKVNKYENITTPTGDVKRFCKPSGWGDYDGSAATKCKGFGVYPDTNRGDTINMCAGIGTRQVFCDYSGRWIYTEGECYCPPEDGWDAVLENTFQSRPCGNNTEYRYCQRFGIWGKTDSSKCFCEAIDYFDPVPYGSVNIDNKCDNGVDVLRQCSTEGVWRAITYNGICKCNAVPNYPEGLVGDYVNHTCSYGSFQMQCSEVGHWEITVNDCACAADGIWSQSALGTTSEVVCANNGRLRRTCNEDGYWEEVQDFNCECPAEGIWSATPAGQYARAGCGNGFVERLCGNDGQWTEVYDRSACYCSPQEGWQLTLSGSSAIKACPAGEQTRQCNEWGQWSTIDYSNCMCKAIDGFEATRIDSYATTTCFDADGVPDEAHSQTRYCDANGEWGVVDQSQCPVKWCPTVDSWYKVPVGHTPTIVTLGCMSGERWRQCNINGEWGPVNTDNCNCIYSTETVIGALLRPGESYSRTCSIGYRTFTCSFESGYFEPVDLSNCKCSADGRFPTTNATQLASAACSSGTATRLCSSEGFWQDVDNSHCYCAQSGIWDRTPIDTTVSELCDRGFRSRSCNTEGYWEDANDSTCVCVADDITVNLGATLTEACDEGSVTRLCYNGHFDEADRSTCFCASRTEYGMIWNRSPAGSESPAITCMNGNVVTRSCTQEGHWGMIDSETCRCTEEDGWSEAGVGEYSYSDCTGHSTGKQRRMCYGTHWGPIDKSTCINECQYDGGDGHIQYIPVGETLEVSCYVNLDGARTYKCVYNETTNESTMVLYIDNCARLNCETDLPPYTIDVGNSETRDCIKGFTGTRTRTCLQGAVWSEYDLSGCQPILCQPTTVDDLFFSFTLAGLMGEAECPTGYSGAMKLQCNIDGQWEGEVINECHKNYCPAEGEWPSIPALSRHNISCPVGYTGIWSRLCQADGTWEPLILPPTCIPRPPTLKTIPFEGMTHVSRAPSASLFSSVAIAAPYEIANVVITSVADPDKIYRLNVNATKSALKGLYGNGGIFADFVLPPDADVHNTDYYLGYGEYKMTFPSRWTALNGATVPPTDLTVMFHTAAIPPSAPISSIEYMSNAFKITVEEPQFVDGPYPVTAYYLSFQPPVYPEVRIDATSHVFGPFSYIPGKVTLLVRAENAIGLSSPDVNIDYSFDDALSGTQLNINIPAPELEVKSQIATENGVEVQVAITVDKSMTSFLPYMDVVCNDESVTLSTSMAPTMYSLIAPANKNFTIACYCTIDNIKGEVVRHSFVPIASEYHFGQVELYGEESAAHIIKLTWSKPAIYSYSAIASYAVQCKLAEATYEQVIFVTSEQVEIDASQFVNGPIQCRVGACTTSSELDANMAWTEVTINQLHTVETKEITYSIVPEGTRIRITATASYCIPMQATIDAHTMDLTCVDGSMVALFTGLTMNKQYTVILESKDYEFYQEEEVTTAATQANDITITLNTDSLTATSAGIDVSMSVEDQVYCFTHTTGIADDIILEQLTSGLYNDLIVPTVPGKHAFIELLSLTKSSTYAVTCVTRYSHTIVTKPNFIATPSYEKPLIVTSVAVTSNDERHVVMDLTFNSHIAITTRDAFLVTCGGVPSIQEIVVNRAIKPYPYALHAEFVNPFVAGTTCSIEFASLDVIRRYNQDDMLSETPFNGKKSIDITISTDDMMAVLANTLTPDMTVNTVSLIRSTEPVVPVHTFDYELHCTRRGVPTVSRTYSTADYPFEFDDEALLSKGASRISLYIGYLPNLHDCEISFDKYALEDVKGNGVICPERDGKCIFTFTSRIVEEYPTVELKQIIPADGAEFVSINQPVQFLFNREVEAVKDIVFRCLDCKEQLVSLPAVCEGLKCVVENAKGWEADRTYHIMYDTATFKAAWENYYYIPSMYYPSFTTAANLCNMEFIAEDWNNNCNCINTGTHCQCNCGATAILKAF